MFTNLAILEGKLAVAGSRISVELILNSLAYDWSVGDVVEICPKIKPEAALAFATDVRRRKLFDTVAEIEVSVGEGRT